MPVKKGHYHKLREKWSKRHEELATELWTKHKDSFDWLSKNTKQLAATSLGSLILLTTPGNPTLYLPESQAKEFPIELDNRVFLMSDLAKILPEDVRELTPEEEQKISEVLSRDFGIKATSVLDGKRLNRNYGIIGAEQHLRRFPGDTMNTHFDTADEANLYYSSGMSPGLGAWGYFAESKEQMTKEDSEKEKYYIAVQTFLAPAYNLRVSEYRDFFKYRKMLVVNPQNGKGIVTVIGDAGPAVWTGKHLGGSAEVMYYLEREDGARRGSVLYFFIDDPRDLVPLGPIQVAS
ncbi:MAG: hypothetical protein UU21_C0001G0119 [Candidatus Levybacteria bacterium GW2011_GWA2_40_8]|nr:MAG: hypothetical protein UU21_C0001G0119 [Candidatus Levybacteria bacterium GW2011_GWA2_40_8]